MNTIHFFDLKGYFTEEVQRLNKLGEKISKTAFVGDKKEARVLDSIDYKQELSLFLDSDINRPAWSDKYVVDSVFNDDKLLSRLVYKSVDDKLKTKQISIEFEANKVSNISIENSTSSTLAKSNQLLIYQPSIGYTIKSQQEVTMANDQEFMIEVRFLK